MACVIYVTHIEFVTLKTVCTVDCFVKAIPLMWKTNQHRCTVFSSNIWFVHNPICLHRRCL